MQTTLRTILFDLDGTLLDTAPDLAAALNQILKENQLPALEFNVIRPWVSHGGIALIKLGFGIEQNHPDFEYYRQRFLDIYKENIAVHTRLFPGMSDVLEELDNNNIRWGVVTNKPGWLTKPLLEQLALDKRCACIISGDTLKHRKPHPAPLQHACELTGNSVKQCLYVGDAQRDIEAGRNAGMQTLVALFGYIQDEDDPQNWGADGLIDSPAGIIEWMNKNNA